MSFHPWMGWALAAGLYLIFRLWYDNWRGPLKPHEIEAFMARAEALWPEGLNDMAVIRRFLEKDDGREFIMCNLLTCRKVSAYVDPLNVPPDPGWSLVGLMRYRSRRDMMVLSTNAAFLRAHEYKMVALTHAMAFPAQPVSSLVAGPRTAVALVLTLAAALTHLAWLSL
jgi:hypothetical protein